MKNKYPDYIMQQMRQRFGLEVSDTSEDNRINAMKPKSVFREICEWNGFLGAWDSIIKGWISGIYGVELD